MRHIHGIDAWCMLLACRDSGQNRLDIGSGIGLTITRTFFERLLRTQSTVIANDAGTWKIRIKNFDYHKVDLKDEADQPKVFVGSNGQWAPSVSLVQEFKIKYGEALWRMQPHRNFKVGKISISGDSERLLMDMALFRMFHGEALDEYYNGRDQAFP